MAARRLLIVMLVLLGVSTLAAALVPQGTLNEADTTATTTQTTTTTPTAIPNPAFLRPTKITVGGKKFPVVSPVHVGDQLSLLVRSRFPTQIEIPEFGLIGFATPDTPARFELLADTPGTFGILFGTTAEPHVTGKPAARIVVVQAGAKKQKKAERPKAKKKARSQNR
jgi:hypothetical protein